MLLNGLRNGDSRSASTSLHSHAPTAVSALPGAVRQPRPKEDGVTVVAFGYDRRYEFHMHYHPPDNWRCQCHIKKRVRFSNRGGFFFAPDDFVSYYPKQPIEFDGWHLAQRWWNANRRKIVRSINEQDWRMETSKCSLVDLVKLRGLKYALYSEASSVWVDVYERLACGHWVCANPKDLLTFPDIPTARAAIDARAQEIRSETGLAAITAALWRRVFRSKAG